MMKVNNDVCVCVCVSLCVWVGVGVGACVGACVCACAFYFVCLFLHPVNKVIVKESPIRFQHKGVNLATWGSYNYSARLACSILSLIHI